MTLPSPTMPAPRKRVSRGAPAVSSGDAARRPDSPPWPPDEPATADDVAPTLVWLDEGDIDSDGLDAFVPETERRLITVLPAAPPGDGPAAPWQRPPPSPPPTHRADADGGRPPRAPLSWVNQAIRAAVVCAVVAAGVDWFLLRQAPASPAVEADMPPLPNIVATAAVPRAPLSPTPFVSLDVSPPVAVAIAPQPEAAEPVAARVTPTAQPIAAVVPAPRQSLPARPADVAVTPRPAANRLPEVARVAAAPPPMNEPSPVIEAPAPPPVRAAEPAPPPAPAAAPRARPAAAAVARVSAVAPPPPGELEARAIDHVLDRYREAFNTLDARAAVTVWPTVNEKALARAFDSLEGQNVSFDDCRIETADVLAEVACSGTARYVRKVGNRGGRAEARQWTFSLRKENGGWLIHRVDSR